MGINHSNNNIPGPVTCNHIINALNNIVNNNTNNFNINNHENIIYSDSTVEYLLQYLPIDIINIIHQYSQDESLLTLYSTNNKDLIVLYNIFTNEIRPIIHKPNTNIRLILSNGDLLFNDILKDDENNCYLNIYRYDNNNLISERRLLLNNAQYELSISDKLNQTKHCFGIRDDSYRLNNITILSELSNNLICCNYRGILYIWDVNEINDKTHFFSPKLKLDVPLIFLSSVSDYDHIVLLNHDLVGLFISSITSHGKLFYRSGYTVMIIYSLVTGSCVNYIYIMDYYRIGSQSLLLSNNRLLMPLYHTKNAAQLFEWRWNDCINTEYIQGESVNIISLRINNLSTVLNNPRLKLFALRDGLYGILCDNFLYIYSKNDELLFTRDWGKYLKIDVKELNNNCNFIFPHYYSTIHHPTYFNYNNNNNNYDKCDIMIRRYIVLIFRYINRGDYNIEFHDIATQQLIKCIKLQPITINNTHLLNQGKFYSSHTLSKNPFYEAS